MLKRHMIELIVVRGTHTVHSTLYTQYIVHTVHSTMYIVHCIFYTIQFQSISGKKAKVVMYTDLTATVGSFGYQIIQKKYFTDLAIDRNTKVCRKWR